jgi:hypothetical protein
MPADEDSSREAKAHRTFLESLLADCRRANWPGGEQLIEQIERELANLPSSDLPDDPPTDPP